MSLDNSLRSLQDGFFKALTETSEPVGLRGRFEVYRYAYFERIRGSIEEDYPLLFAFLEAIEDFPSGLDSVAVTRDLLARNHPRSWTLAEASLPVLASVEALLADFRWSKERAEARRLALLDEAEGLASWLEEWPKPKTEKDGWVPEFVAGRLALVRTKTWREAGDRVFWRSDRGVREAASSEFGRYSEFFPFVASPISFVELTDRAERVAEPSSLSTFIQSGIAEGWLRLVPNGT